WRISRKCLTRLGCSGEAFPTKSDAKYVIGEGMLAPLHRYHNLGVHPGRRMVFMSAISQGRTQKK
ncbi:MAG: hypothetical protein Q7N50_04585, partial [Armatimonadota bacterium]|nr:hypothetical protein [Armatimonadota bacterium]